MCLGQTSNFAFIKHRQKTSGFQMRSFFCDQIKEVKERGWDDKGDRKSLSLGAEDFCLQSIKAEFFVYPKTHFIFYSPYPFSMFFERYAHYHLKSFQKE